MSNYVSVETSGKIRIVRFTNPDGRNPLSSSVLEILHRVVSDCEESSANCLVFTGSDRVFASGANLREIAGLSSETAPDFARYGQMLMNRIAALRQTTVAAVNGFCFGGALDLALACDRRIASHNASFAHPGVGLGIITGWGGTQRLPRLIGQANSLEMFFTAEAINAGRAYSIGLVDLVADDIFNNELLNIDRHKFEAV